MSECIKRGPYLPGGDVAWECLTHGVELVRIIGEHGTTATREQMACPVTTRSRADQQLLSSARDHAEFALELAFPRGVAMHGDVLALADAYEELRELVAIWMMGDCPMYTPGCRRQHLCPHCYENAVVDFDLRRM